MGKFPEVGIDQKEMGKILIIASCSLLVVSLHAFYSFHTIEDEISNVTDQADETMAVLQSDQFQSSLEALRDVNALSVDRNIQTITEGMSQVASSLENSREISERAENSKRTYQWLTLLSILGLISGLVLFFMER